eukprot:SAG11_NODE_36570_length_261_cov_0.493827_1_plen_38_part_10
MRARQTRRTRAVKNTRIAYGATAAGGRAAAAAEHRWHS